MRNTLFIFAFLIASAAQSQTYYDLIQYERDSINAEFGDPEHSILKEEDVAHFEGLPFYVIDKKYFIHAKFKKKKGKVFKMKTSTDRLPEYRRYGYLTFEFEGKKYTLTVYQNIGLTEREGYEDYLFLPFTDLTSGEESYGGGRYIDMRIGDLKDPVIDFNTCYNPYCAYNDRYSCPIPPAENFLNFEVKAGAKKWH